MISGFDFHCHIDLFPDPLAVIERCHRSRIATLAVTTTPKAWPQNVRWAKSSPFIFPAVGLHPELASERSREAELMEELIAVTPFVGEIGLDGSSSHKKSLPIQIEIFSRALIAAQKGGGRVLTIHSRAAALEVLGLLAKHTTSDRVLPILHWFTGSGKTVVEATRRGCYFSINRRMLMGAAGAELIRAMPLTSLLTETDAPFTDTDSDKAGPQDIETVVAALAQLRSVSLAEMTEIIRVNSQRVLAFAGVAVPD